MGQMAAFAILYLRTGRSIGKKDSVKRDVWSCPDGDGPRPGQRASAVRVRGDLTEFRNGPVMLPGPRSLRMGRGYPASPAVRKPVSRVGIFQDLANVCVNPTLEKADERVQLTWRDS